MVYLEYFLLHYFRCKKLWASPSMMFTIIKCLHPHNQGSPNRKPTLHRAETRPLQRNLFSNHTIENSALSDSLIDADGRTITDSNGCLWHLESIIAARRNLMIASHVDAFAVIISRHDWRMCVRCCKDKYKHREATTSVKASPIAYAFWSVKKYYAVRTWYVRRQHVELAPNSVWMRIPSLPILTF